MQQKVNIALIGYGYWGPNILRNLVELSDIIKLNCVCDMSQARLKEIARKYPGIQTTTELCDVLDNADISAVVVATPAKTHYEITKLALSKGKHVMVEKPIALSTREAQDLVDLAEKKKLILMAGHTFIYNPAVIALKALIKDGTLGELYYIHSTRVNLGQIRRDVNALWNFAPHDVSILLYLLDAMPTQVSAKGKKFLQPDVEDLVFVNLDFDSNIMAHLHLSWLDPSKTRKMTIVGSKKMVIYDDVDNEGKIKVYDKGADKFASSQAFGEFQIKLRAGDVLIPKLSMHEPLKKECEHFIKCIMENKVPLTDGRNGLRVVKVLTAAQESLKNEGKVVKIT